MKSGPLAAVLLAAASLLPGALVARADDPPGLVLLLVVDQLRRDRIDDRLPGGLGRLAREGRVYPEAMLEHAMSETCPGHAAVATGRHPGRVGVPGNHFLDPRTRARRYCVEDRSDQGRVLGQPDPAPEDGRSPRNLRVDALGDWLKRASPSSRVIAISAKDRGAITLGGRRPDGVYWFSKQAPVGFTTSRYYTSELPGWLVAWNGADPLGDGLLASLPPTWLHAPAAAARSPRADDYRGESKVNGRTSGHPLREGDAETVAAQVYASPYIDTLTVDLALRAIEHERLGQRGVTDLLAVSLSGTDLVGHAYGPRSHESSDALLRLDADVGRLLEAAERSAGPVGVLVALTSDHGVLELPEWIAEQGRRRCPSRSLRAGILPLFVGLHWRLHREIGPLWSMPRQWVEFAGTQLAVRRDVAAERGVDVAEVVSLVRAHLESQPELARVWTLDEIRSGDSPTAALYRNSVDPERSGDLVVEVAPTCLLSFLGTGTTHGTPHAYDREIPLIFHGQGVTPGRIAGRAASVDVAPSLAGLLGIATPPDVEGRNLLER